MTIANIRAARAEMVAAFNTVWQANAGAVNGGTVPGVHWEGSKFDRPTDTAWARFVIRHTLGEQATLSGDTNGLRRYEKFGFVSVQIFAPISSGGGLSLADDLADVAKSAFEGKSTDNGIWFQNVRINEVGVDDAWVQVNVIADFRYDELG